jgi:hypothetical protein
MFLQRFGVGRPRDSRPHLQTCLDCCSGAACSFHFGDVAPGLRLPAALLWGSGRVGDCGSQQYVPLSRFLAWQPFPGPAAHQPLLLQGPWLWMMPSTTRRPALSAATCLSSSMIPSQMASVEPTKVRVPPARLHCRLVSVPALSVVATLVRCRWNHGGERHLRHTTGRCD